MKANIVKIALHLSLIKIYSIIINPAYIHTYHSRFIPEGVAEEPQIFLQIFQRQPRFTKIS
jgi:hypothetical protein